MQPVLDAPVPLNPAGDPFGLGLEHRLGTDQVDHLAALLAFDRGGAAQLQDLPRTGETDPGWALDGFDGSGVAAAVCLLGAGVAGVAVSMAARPMP